MALEFVAEQAVLQPDGTRRLDDATVAAALLKKTLRYDKSGDEHYNLISAYIKSLRDSDPDGALYWLARMLEAGEDPKFIARRLMIFASEDVGNADPLGIVGVGEQRKTLKLLVRLLGFMVGRAPGTPADRFIRPIVVSVVPNRTESYRGD